MLDFRTADEDLQLTDVQAFAAKVLRRRRGEAAIVVPDMELFGLARMFEIAAQLEEGDEGIRVFTKMEERGVVEVGRVHKNDAPRAGVTLGMFMAHTW